MGKLICLMAVGLLAACAAPDPTLQFVPSNKSAVELRAAQTRMVDGDVDTVMRGVIATVQDLGYRITKVEPGAGTVSAVRQTALRMAIVVRPRTPQESVVRANATIVALRREAQVDSPLFYQQDFFEPLSAMLHRNLTALADDVVAPEPSRPASELNTKKEREAAAHRPPSGAPTPATGTKTP